MKTHPYFWALVFSIIFCTQVHAASCNKPAVIEKLETYIASEEASESSWYNPASMLKDWGTISSHERLEQTVESAKYMDESKFCNCYSELEEDHGQMKKPIEEFCKNLADGEIKIVMAVYDMIQRIQKK